MVIWHDPRASTALATYTAWQRERGVAESTIRVRENYLRRWCEELGDPPVSRITQSMLQSVYESGFPEPWLKVQTRNNYRRWLQGWLGWLYGQRLIPGPLEVPWPWEPLPPPRPRNPFPR